MWKRATAVQASPVNASEELPPLRWYEDRIRETCRRTGIADPACANWLAPIVRECDRDGEGNSNAARRARTLGKAMSAAEKKAVGINGNTKISREAFATLTPIGRTDPVRAYEALVHEPIKQRCQARHAEMISHFNARAKVQVRGGSHTCAAARRLGGKTVAADRVPSFPLPDCDQWICTCSYRAELPRERRRKRRWPLRLIVLIAAILGLATMMG